MRPRRPLGLPPDRVFAALRATCSARSRARRPARSMAASAPIRSGSRRRAARFGCVVFTLDSLPRGGTERSRNCRTPPRYRRGLGRSARSCANPRGTACESPPPAHRDHLPTPVVRLARSPTPASGDGGRRASPGTPVSATRRSDAHVRARSNVVSKAKLCPCRACASICLNTSLPASTAARAGRKGLSPAAIRSALTKIGQSASLGRNSVANVVLPARSVPLPRGSACRRSRS